MDETYVYKQNYADDNVKLIFFARQTEYLVLGMMGRYYPDEGAHEREFLYLKVPPSVSLKRSSTIRPDRLIFSIILRGLLRSE